MPLQQPDQQLYRRIPHKTEPGVYAYEPVNPSQTPIQQPKPSLTGVCVITDTLKGRFTDQEKAEMNFWQGFFSALATSIRDYDQGLLVIDRDPVPDDVKAAYRAADNGEWPKE